MFCEVVHPLVQNTYSQSNRFIVLVPWASHKRLVKKIIARGSFLRATRAVLCRVRSLEPNEAVVQLWVKLFFCFFFNFSFLRRQFQVVCVIFPPISPFTPSNLVESSLTHTTVPDQNFSLKTYLS